MVNRLHETYDRPTLNLATRRLMHETYDSIDFTIIGLINETYDILGPRECIHETYDTLVTRKLVYETYDHTALRELVHDTCGTRVP